MEPRRPPKRLPREYLEIWSALEEADRIASSRSELARRLHVSTLTLQRILVDGAVPRLSRTESTRVLHSWTRILTRLACYFGKEPRRWVELAGVRWTEATSEVSRAAERGLEGTRWPAGGTGKDSIPAPALRVPAAEASTNVEIGLVDGSPFGLPLYAGGSSFFQEYARRLLLAVDPSLRPVYRTIPEAELLRALTHPQTPLVFGIGLAATAARRRTGLAFLSLPGCRLRFSALRRVRTAEAAIPLEWDEATRTDGGARLVVRDQGPAHLFLSGACGIPAGRLVPVANSDSASPATGQSRSPAETLAAAFLEESATGGDGPLFLVDDAATCLDVRRRIERDGRAAFRLVELPRSESVSHSYPLAVVVATGTGLPRLWRAARDRELFAAAREETARLYADFLAAAHRREPYETAVRLGSFRQGGSGFRSALCRALLSALPEPASTGLRPAAEPADASGPVGPYRPPSPRTIDTARSLLPATWGGSLEEVVRGLTPHPAAWHCRSCSASLHEAHNQGASDHYCRYCSDEQGRLRPREEVRRILARWFTRWQGEMPLEEAVRRADSYMQAMPAWSEN